MELRKPAVLVGTPDFCAWICAIRSVLRQPTPWLKRLAKAKHFIWNNHNLPHPLLPHPSQRAGERIAPRFFQAALLQLLLRRRLPYRADKLFHHARPFGNKERENSCRSGWALRAAWRVVCFWRQRRFWDSKSTQAQLRYLPRTVHKFSHAPLRDFRSLCLLHRTFLVPNRRRETLLRTESRSRMFPMVVIRGPMLDSHILRPHKGTLGLKGHQGAIRPSLPVSSRTVRPAPIPSNRTILR